MNILVDHLGRARITDFALAAVSQDKCSTCGVMKMHKNNTRWTAPEILEETGPLTKKADVFSFAMVMIEVSRGVWCIVTCASSDHYFDEGLHWHGSIQRLSGRYIDYKNNTGGAPATASRPSRNRRRVGVDTKVLGSGSPIAPRNERSTSGSSFEPTPESPRVQQVLVRIPNRSQPVLR